MYTHLDFVKRDMIEIGLNDGYSFTTIADTIGVSTSTISREVTSHLKVERTGGMGQPFNACKHLFDCDVRLLCGNACPRNRSFCKNCNQLCNLHCKRFVPNPCPNLSHPPYVCNGCQKRGACRLEKRFYRARFAQNESNHVWIESHSGLSYSEEEIKRIDQIVSPLLKRGLSLNHILANNKDSLMVSKSTLYRMVNDGLLSAISLDLPRKVRYKARRKPRPLKLDKSCRIGRTYSDFCRYMAAHPGETVVQLDSVEGKKGGKVLLTVHFVHCELMLAFLRDCNDAASVIRIFDHIQDRIGFGSFQNLFRVCLADNGSEFSDPIRLECDLRSDSGELRTLLFYCDPNAPQQKGSAEKNHELIRYVLPKGTSFDHLSQIDIDRLMNHINSYSRPSLGNKSPFEVFSFFYGPHLLDALNIRRIPPNQVYLKPDFFSRGVL